MRSSAGDLSPRAVWDGGQAIMERKFKNRSFCMLSADLIESEAFLGLSGRAAMLCLVRFHQKVYRRKVKKNKRLKSMKIMNNGEIIFTYGEAVELRIAKRTFHRVLRELIEQKGFIDLSTPGGYYGNEPNKYAISERWRLYGTAEFQAVKMPRMLPEGESVKTRYQPNTD